MPDRDRPAGPATLVLPPAAAEPARAGFPWIASTAPVAAAIAIWAITGSAFALVFAALGPVVAFATMLDARRIGARARRRALADRADAIARLRIEVEARHATERDAAWRRSPSARAAVDRAVPMWRHAAPPPIVVGRGPVASELRLDGVAVDDADTALVDDTARLDGAPVRVDVRHGIGFVGDPVLARAAARAVLVQCADAVGPAELALQVPDRDWEWATVLPHRRGGPPSPTLVVHEPSRTTRLDGPDAAGARQRAAFRIAVARDPAALPPGIGSVLHLASPRTGVLHRTARRPIEVEPELLAVAEASAWAARLEQAARRAGLAGPDRDLPRRVPFSSLPLPATARPGDRTRLPAVVGIADDGPVELELTSGPHALVAGTTGSGKSEFLLAWITSLALAHPPDRVAFLLVDFKGGAAFAPVASLPHVTGIVTDLDDTQAARAVASLRAEVRHRELVLRAAGARDLATLPDGIELPRLVVVVDEFQAMVERFPELGDVIADLAARGRSLGVHLVLASQRPNGVVREQVMANCGIRVSLRVLQRADSLAVVGTDGAALLEPGRPGLGIADGGDGRRIRFQSAIADEEAIEAVASCHAEAAPPRRPWLDPLPELVTLDTVDAVLAHGRSGARGIAGRGADDGEAILLGVVDEPDRQRRSPAAWRPAHDGPLIVLGTPHSGRSGLLAAIARQVEARHGLSSVLRVEGSRSAVWDALEASGGIDAGAGRPALVVLDDLDTRFASWPDEYRLAALLRVEELLRISRRSGVAVAASAVRSNGMGAGIRDGFTTTAFLRHASRSDLVHAGGAGTHWGAHEPPGSGQWRGLRAQFLHSDLRPDAAEHPIEPVAFDGLEIAAVASATPEADATALRAHLPGAEVIRLGSTPGTAVQAMDALESVAAGSGTESHAIRLIVGDAEDWAANWSLAHAARSRATIVVHGGHAEFRSLARATALPPLLDDPTAQCWIAHPEHAPARRAWLTR
ncbi:S-DNA-T family DNA segregation ATPase FtsK/SpoIIIE [Agromyces flavus]|uniref:S-DNA-T family DNA segregation ATPase FtsK/SpoIIIE n=1 Tax=Agromyces flavus TaxID=589382 RepID=A0ABT1KN69_9MICO|nr:FtsK/SpoIIIE domain-containing protein [Agromyces flavus]MCP2368347.1 S-DNA-T family DNA segregation ATPase FtsK/SpoIIIE [Agromyces flavus]